MNHERIKVVLINHNQRLISLKLKKYGLDDLAQPGITLNEDVINFEREWIFDNNSDKKPVNIFKKKLKRKFSLDNDFKM